MGYFDGDHDRASQRHLIMQLLEGRDVKAFIGE
jgi:hypothetical protein